MSSDGNTIAVSASSLSLSTSSSPVGTVQVYENNGASNHVWNPIGQILHGTTLDYEYGSNISLYVSNDGVLKPRLAVSERFYHDKDDNMAYAGRVHVYQLSSSSNENSTKRWIELGEPIVGQRQGETFGRAVTFSKDGNVLAIGASNPQGA
eukprot:14092236-Ditylum_brightwellii.AAC.1